MLMTMMMMMLMMMMMEMDRIELWDCGNAEMVLQGVDRRIKR